VRYEFNWIDKSRGGLSVSARKTEAARKNGKSGGRPSDRLLIERILNRRVESERSKEVLPWDNSQANWPQIRDKILSRVSDRRIVTSYFECDWMDISTRSWKHLPLAVRQVLRQIRRSAKIFFSRPVRFKRPKNYVVMRVEKSSGHESEESWKSRHPDMPWCPTVPRRVPLSTLFNYWWCEHMYKQGVQLTEADILRNGENRLTMEQTHAIWLWLNYQYRTKKSQAK
jgi:hypothetical protein